MSPPQNHATMFYSEGTTTAVLVDTSGEVPCERAMTDLPTPEAALAWCRLHAVCFVYLPPELARN